MTSVNTNTNQVIAIYDGITFQSLDALIDYRLRMAVIQSEASLSNRRGYTKSPGYDVRKRIQLYTDTLRRGAWANGAPLTAERRRDIELFLAQQGVTSNE